MLFFDDFEDGNIDDWMSGGSGCGGSMTDETAAGGVYGMTMTPAPLLGVILRMPADYFAPGDPFYLDAGVGNTGLPDDYVQLFVALSIAGDYWFWPSWIRFGQTGEIDFQTLSFRPGVTTYTIIDEFSWPDPGCELAGIQFVGAVMNVSMTELIGELSSLEWGYGP